MQQSKGRLIISDPYTLSRIVSECSENAVAKDVASQNGHPNGVW